MRTRLRQVGLMLLPFFAAGPVTAAPSPLAVSPLPGSPLAMTPPADAETDGDATAELGRALAGAAPDIDRSVLGLALQSLQCATRDGMPASSRLAVIDYSRPSLQPRLWVFDLERRKLMFRELVAHGRNSGDNLTRFFSNENGSLASSIGLFRTDETYVGSNGYSLRLDGLEPGFNDRARERAIVMHGAPYVNDSIGGSLGRLGRSWGCPAVRLGVARQLIDTLKGGQFLFSYYPDQRWLKTSHLLSCDQPRGRTQAVVADNSRS